MTTNKGFTNNVHFITDSLTAILSLTEASNHLLSGGREEQEIAINLMIANQEKLKTLLAFACRSTITLPQPLVAAPEVEPPLNFSLSDSAHSETVQHDPSSVAGLGQRIRMSRKKLGLTPTQLAAQLKVKRRAITMWELEKSSPAVTRLPAIALALKCDLTWLLFGGVPESKPAPEHYKDKEAELNIPAFLRRPILLREEPINVMQGVDMAGLGKRITTRIMELDMTIDSAARDMEITPALLVEWQTGRTYPTARQIDVLSLSLACRVTWLLTGRGEIENVMRES